MLAQLTPQVWQHLAAVKELTVVTQWLKDSYQLTLERLVVVEEEKDWHKLRGEAAVLKSLIERIAESRDAVERIRNSN